MPVSSALPPHWPAPDDLLRSVFAVSLTAINLLGPVYGPGGELVDFTLEYLNPAGQRMVGLPERPDGTITTHFPATVAAGVLAFYRRVYESGEPGRYDLNYQADGLDNYFQLAATRTGDLLVVSFADTADQDRSAVEVALRESQAREQQAHAKAERERQRLQQVLLQLPAQVAVHHGPDQVFTLVNPAYQRLFPTRTFQGLPVREALPELASAGGILDLLDEVYRTGEPFHGTEMELWVDFTGNGQPEQVYLNAVFLPLRDAQGSIEGVLDFSVDVTEQVLARQQVQHLNQALEARVAQRTQEVEAARAVAEQQRARLSRLWQQAPAAICMFSGPDLVFELVNPVFQAFFPDRPLLGKPMLQALPELAGHAAYLTMKQVFDTGETLLQQAFHTPLARTEGGALEDRYFNYIQQPRYDEQGRIDGVLVFSFEVTEMVQARQHAEALQAEVLAAAQRQAQEREALYHVMAHTPAAVALLRGPEHRFEYVNAAYQQLFPERQLTGKSVAEALPETREAGFLTELDRVYRTGETFFGQELPMRVQPEDGRPIQQVYYTFTYQAYRENEQVAGISIFAFDVTEQVMARRKGETERQRLLNLFQQAPAGICILAGPDLVFEFINPRYEQLLPGRPLHGKPVFEAMPELVGTPVADMLQEVFATGQTHEEQALLIPLARPADGLLEDRYFTFTYQARRNDEGAVDGILAFVFEVTEQIRARQKIEESEARFRIMADVAPNQVWAVNPDSTIRYANRAFLDFVGMSLEQYQQNGWSVCLHPEEIELAQQTLETAIRTRTLYVLEHRMRRHDGQYRWLLSQGAPSFYPNGELYGYVGSAIDITELKQANEQLLRTNVDLDNFIYTASHDLKAPISNIEGLLYLLQEELPDEVTQDADVGPTLALMLDAVERFKRTIEHLTDVSKLQKEHASDATLVNLAAVVEGVRQDLRPQLEAAGAKLSVDVALLPPIHFSEKNLRSIVYNLVSNAVKYRHPDRTPHVDVRAHVRPDHTVLEVHDNGLGLDPAQVPRLFTMFQRFHDHVEGTGIGLYMIHRMVENAGGRIEVHSQLGAGTTFFVFLPHATSPAGHQLAAYASS